MKQLTRIPLVVALAIVPFSCDPLLLGPLEENNALHNYEYLWEDFQASYGPFCVKDLNWDSLGAVYGGNLSESSSDQELYKALTGLLGELHDNHVSLVPTDPQFPFFQSGIVGELGTFTDFRASVVRDRYLSGDVDSRFDCLFGRLDGDIGYVHLTHVSAGVKLWEDFFDAAFAALGDTRGMIVDLRNNSGGNDQEAVYIAGRFAREEKDAFGFRLKDGPGMDDYTPFHFYKVKPEGKTRYHKPLVVLTHRFTISAGETLTMSFRRLDQVTVVGDTTSGAFSDMTIRELPNGWAYTISIGDWRDHNLVSYEGIGLAPDVPVLNRPEDLATGRDEALEAAMALLAAAPAD
ncbi:MAG: S41 family peptidase [Bacteroidales bacterium]